MIDLLIPTGINIYQAWSTALNMSIQLQEQLASIITPKKIIDNHLSAQNVSDILQPLKDVMHDMDEYIQHAKAPNDQMMIS